MTMQNMQMFSSNKTSGEKLKCIYQTDTFSFVTVYIWISTFSFFTICHLKKGLTLEKMHIWYW